MYRPGANWKNLAHYLSAAILGDGAPFLDRTQLDLLPFVARDDSDLAGHTVECLDAPPAEFATRQDAVNELVDAIVDRTERVNELFGPVHLFGCWSVRARPVEWYNGPWNATPANDILIIGNTVRSAHALI